MLSQKILGILQPPRSVLRPYLSSVYITRVQRAFKIRNSADIHSNTALFDFKTV